MKVITNNKFCITNQYSGNLTSVNSPMMRDSRCLNQSLNKLSFLGKSQVLTKLTKEQVLTKHSDFIETLGEIAKGVKEFISEKKDGAEELLNLNTLLEIFDSPKYAKYENLIRPDKSIFKGFSKGKTIPQALSEDLKLVRTSDNLLDNYVPKVSYNDALTKSKTGDVFQITGSDLVSMKTKDGSISELKMKRQDFIDLFPPVKRFAGIQSKEFGNCYEETAINSIISNPETRENIFSSIDTISSKNRILVTFPNGVTHSEITINPADITKNDSNKYYTQGCKGLQYIQHALGLEYEKEFIEQEIISLVRKGKNAQAAWVNQNRENSTRLANHFRGRYPDTTLGINLRDGGNAVVPWHKLGLKDIGESSLAGEKNYTITEAKLPTKYKHETDNREFTKRYLGEIFTEDLDGFWGRLESPKFLDTHTIQVSVSEDNALTKFKPDHSYGLRAIKGKDGKIEGYLVKDPHEITETPLTFEEVLDNFDYMSFAKFK